MFHLVLQLRNASSRFVYFHLRINRYQVLGVAPGSVHSLGQHLIVGTCCERSPELQTAANCDKMVCRQELPVADLLSNVKQLLFQMRAIIKDNHLAIPGQLLL